MPRVVSSGHLFLCLRPNPWGASRPWHHCHDTVVAAAAPLAVKVCASHRPHPSRSRVAGSLLTAKRALLAASENSPLFLCPPPPRAAFPSLLLHIAPPPPRPFPDWPPLPPKTNLLTTRYTNTHLSPQSVGFQHKDRLKLLASDIASSKADIVLLQEYDQWMGDAMTALGVHAHYPYVPGE
jgi:hypothetical protein